MENSNGPSRKDKNRRANVPGIPINPADLDPGLLREWQNYILEFERQYQKNKTIKVYHRLGRPSFIAAVQLDEPALSRELQRITRLMEDCGLFVSSLCPISDRTLYRFITEELFEYEMEDVQMPGMKTQFCYEAFHPNHEFDLIHYTEDGLQNILSTEEDYWILGFQDRQFYSQTGHLLAEGALEKKVQLFKQCFASFEIVDLQHLKVEYDMEAGKATTSFFIHYEAYPFDSRNPLEYKGKGEFGFDYCCEDWFINQLHFPGLSI